MEFQSILFADTGQEKVQQQPVFFQELYLDYILKIIRNTAADYQINPYFYTFPCTKELVNYRHQVFKDLSDNGLREAVRKFCYKMHKSRHSHAFSLKCEEPAQAAAYHLEAAMIYWDALQEFGNDLGLLTPVSEGMDLLKEYVQEKINQCREKKFGEATERAYRIFSCMRFRLVIGQNQVTVEEEHTGDGKNLEEQGDYLQKLIDLLKPESGHPGNTLKGIFPDATRLSYLETTLISMLKKSRPAVFDELNKFKKEFPDFYSSRLVKFEEEVQFYLAFLDFKEKTEERGYSMCLPVITDSMGNAGNTDSACSTDSICSTNSTGGNGFYGTGVYDISLVWKNANRNYKVVANDFNYEDIPLFFVVTGANQGGKTTFARSMGQAVYFSLMGLPTCAMSFSVPYFKGISTHFEAEEKVQSNAGKLKDEINRLAPVMKQDKTFQFVILNELFTTATTNDACIMGKKVMEHFLKRNCCGIYVTHIQELAEETGKIKSLVAQVEGDAEKIRTYRIIPMKAQGYAYSGSLVEQFHLTYKDIMEIIP